MRDETLEAYKERERFDRHPRRQQATKRFHITYIKNGRTEVGRVVMADDRTVSASALREAAITAASFKFGVSRIAVKSAVGLPEPQ